MKFKIPIIVILLCAAVIGQAQKPSDFANKYDKEIAVRLKSHTLVEIEIDDEELSVNRTNILRTYMVSSQLNGINKVSLDYEPPFTTISDIDAYTLVPDFEKDKYSKEKVRDIIDRKVLDDNVFHDGTRAKSFEFEGVRKGGITELEYEEEITEPRLIGREVFGSSMLTLDHSLSLEYDEDIKLGFDYFNCDSTWFEIEKSSSRGKKIITWRRKNIEALRSESNQPPFLSLAPHIIYRVKSYKVDDNEIPMLQDVSGLYQWYSSFIKDLDKDLSPELLGITDSLVADKSDDFLRAKAIYDWVNTAIRYIAFEDGLGGFKPREANLVCDRRYGDCKDMANIMVSMMKHAGLNAYHVWVGTRDLPYTYQRVPSVLADNHMIAALNIKGQFYFLDATHKALPFPYPSISIQGKDALISLGPDDFTVKQIPVVDSKRNLDRDSITLSLQGEDLSGNGYNFLYGYNAQRFNRIMEQKDQKIIDDIIKATFRKGNNRCKASLVDFQRGDTVSQLNYTFDVPQYAYLMEDKLYLNLNLEKVFENLAVEKDREHPLSFERTFFVDRLYHLPIPEGYTLEYIPEEQNKTFKGFGYRAAYSEASPGVVEYRLQIDLNRLEIGHDELENWNQFINDLKKIYTETIILKKA